MSLLGYLDPIDAVKRKVLAGIGVAVLLVIAGLAAWGARVDHLRAGWQGKYGLLHNQAEVVRVALKFAACDPGEKCAELKWEDAAGQAVALGDSNRELKGRIATQNQRIDQLAQDAVKLKARAAELQSIADKARAQRKAALDRLSDMAITPGTRADCEQLLKEANDALDTVYEAGL